MLERFGIQIRQLTLNAFARPGVFVMALKMMGCELKADTFIQFYEAQVHRKVIKDRQTEAELVVEFGSYNLVPKKTRGNISIVPTYRNKWPRWTNFRFYHRVCTDEMVTEALANDLPRASTLVSEMTPMAG